jgi:hypothetical protein
MFGEKRFVLDQTAFSLGTDMKIAFFLVSAVAVAGPTVAAPPDSKPTPTACKVDLKERSGLRTFVHDFVHRRRAYSGFCGSCVRMFAISYVE